MNMIDAQLKMQIETFADKALGTGATPRDIANAEEALGVQLPPTYRDFLSEYGWARFSTEELYGIGDSVPSHLELVRNVVAERNEMEPKLPIHLIPILNDGAGNHYCMDASPTQQATFPVVFWDHAMGSNQTPERVNNSFDAWLIELLKRLELR